MVVAERKRISADATKCPEYLPVMISLITIFQLKFWLMQKVHLIILATVSKSGKIEQEARCKKAKSKPCVYE